VPGADDLIFAEDGNGNGHAVSDYKKHILEFLGKVRSGWTIINCARRSVGGTEHTRLSAPHSRVIELNCPLFKLSAWEVFP